MGFDGLLDVLKSASILGVYIYQDEGRIVFANRAFLSFVEYKEEEIIGKRLPELLEGEEKKIAVKNIKRRLSGEKFPFEYSQICYKTKSGYLKPSLNFSYTIEYNGKPAGVVISIDMQKQRTYEVLFKSLSEINQLIVRCEDEENLLRSICDILVNKVGFRLVVVGELQKSTKRFDIKYFDGKESVVEYFKGVFYYLEDALNKGKGTISGAFERRKIFYSEDVYKDPKMANWREDFRKNGIYSVASIPIFKNNKLKYMLIIYSGVPNRFSEEYIHILKELQLDVSFALKKIEEKRELTIFNEALHSTQNWIVITDNTGKILRANKAVETISGYSSEELIGKKPSIFKSGYHDDSFYKKLWDKIKKGEQERYNFINRKKDGSLFYLESVIVPVIIKNKLYRIIDIGRDITLEVIQKEKIKKISNLYRTLSDINKLLLESKTKEDIFEELPNLVLNNLGCEIAFIIGVNSKGKFTIKSSRVKDNRYNEYLKKEIAFVGKSSDTPFSLSLKDGKVHFDNNIRANKKLAAFHGLSLKYNLNSCFSMPIIQEGKTLGVLVGIMSETDVFDAQIYALLEKTKDNINYALSKLEAQKWLNIMSYAVDAGFDFVVITDNKFRIVYANEKTEEISEYSKEELIGKHHSVFSAKTYSRAFISNFYRTLLNGEIFSGLMVYKTKSSKIVKAIMNIMPFRINGKIEYYISVGKDITKEAHLQETIEDVLNHDYVTGLINRRAFIKSLERFMERAGYENKLAALSVINPIEFSSVNRAFGFETGNMVLNEISKRIKTNLREYDVVAKLESDKFCVLLKDIKHEENALWIFTNLMNKLSKPYRIGDKFIGLSFNMGISLYPKDDVRPEGLLEKAMVALIDAKKKGEASLGFYKEEFEKEAMHKLELRNDIKNALSKNEFVIYYQPYFSSKDKRLVGAEALIRWKRNGKIIPPLEFIPFLERTKMISSIEKWVVNKVLSTITGWKKAGLDVVPVSINISPSSFNNFNFAKDILFIIDKYNIEKNLINIEIIERLFLENMEYVKRTIRTLKKYGLSFSIDDFGTGYSSLSYLAKLSVDYVKIDISFVREMLKNDNTRAIVETIVYLTKRLKIKTIAEGVEENEQLEFLKNIKCDFIQGYLFSKPLPEDEFEKLLRLHTKSNSKK